MHRSRVVIGGGTRALAVEQGTAVERSSGEISVIDNARGA